MMMSQSKYSLTWEAHLKNVCTGLSNLQQNEEFVDMTLAADGHMVKVHQVVLALASPYFKELITSAQCPHPVIFLSKINHVTLSAILEYIYTGEVLVSLEHLNDLVEAARELHIKGLKDMKVHSLLTETPKQQKPDGEMLEDEDLGLFQEAQAEDDNINVQEQQQMDGVDNMIQYEYEDEHLDQQITEDVQDEQVMVSTQGTRTKGSLHSDIELDDEGNAIEQVLQDEDMRDTDLDVTYESNKLDPTSALQYTVSNQGSLQLILNRFVYYLKHTNRDRSRQWRCVDYLSHMTKCPAHVFTKDDIVVHRIAAHNHPFHDKKILKKLKNGAVFSAFTEAERDGHIKKRKTMDSSHTE